MQCQRSGDYSNKRQWRVRTLCIHACLVLLLQPSAAADSRYVHVELSKLVNVLPGDTVVVQLGMKTLNSESTQTVKKIDFGIRYESDLFEFIGAELSNDSRERGWTDFGFLGLPGDECGSGGFKLFADFDSSVASDSVALSRDLNLNLSFVTRRDTMLFDAVSDLVFCWTDCLDNTVALDAKDTLLCAQSVYDADGIQLTDSTDWIPSSAGPDNHCLEVGTLAGKILRPDLIFTHGRVSFISRDSIGSVGDVNLDGYSFELADFDLVGDYCLFGDEAFSLDLTRQSLAADIDADNRSGTVADWLLMAYRLDNVVNLSTNADESPTLTLEKEGFNNRTDIWVDLSAPCNAFALRADIIWGNIDSIVFAEVLSSRPNLHKREAFSATRISFAFTGGSPDEPLVDSGFIRLAKIHYRGSARFSNIGVEAATPDAQLFRRRVATPVNEPYGTSTLPKSVALYQNYPNPFNPSTTIEFVLARAAHWTIEIFDTRGHRVRTFTGESSSGVQRITWDGRNRFGSLVASGVYYYRLSAAGETATRRMLLLR